MSTESKKTKFEGLNGSGRKSFSNSVSHERIKEAIKDMTPKGKCILIIPEAEDGNTFRVMSHGVTLIEMAQIYGLLFEDTVLYIEKISGE